jgi:hypothetical protein
MVRMPETKAGMVVAALGVLVAVGVILPLAFIGALSVAFSSWSSFPSDDPSTMAGPVTARTVFADVDRVADGDVHRAGVDYRCRLRATGPRRYRCVVPGHGAGDLVYRVTVSSQTSCWRARGEGPRMESCITVPADAGVD